MTPYNEISSLNDRLAVGIVVDHPHIAWAASVENALRMTPNVFILNVSGDASLAASEGFSGVRTISMDPCEDFAAARNALIEAVEAENEVEWLFWMNGGEIFDEETLPFFLEFFEKEAERDSLYVLVLHRLFHRDRSRNDLDEESIDARLMPLKKGLRFEGTLCPSLFPSAARLLIQPNAAPGRLLDFREDEETEVRRQRARRKLDLLEKLEAEGVAATDDALLRRGECLTELGDHTAARQDFEKLIQTTSKANLRLEAYYRLWDTFAFAPMAPNEMTKALLGGIDHFPVDMQLLTFMGSHLQRQGQLDLAIRTFQTAVQHGRISLDASHRLHIGEMAILSLALAHRLKGDGKEAIRVLELNIGHIADRSKYDQQLLDLYISEQDEEKALELAAMIWGDAELDRMRELLSGACRAAGGRWESALPSLESAYTEGYRHMIGLRWYAMTLLALLQFDKAVPVLEEWAAREPENTEPRSLLLAARQPEQFHEILGRILATQRKKLGLPAVSPLPRKGKRPAQGLEEIVREMIVSSGTLTDDRINLSPCRGPAKKIETF